MAGPDLLPDLPGCTDLVLVRSGVPRVYRCQRRGTDATALVYPARVDSTTATAFTKQAEALGKISHPQVAPVLDAGLSDGLPYLVSAPDAGTLAEQLRIRRLSPADLAVLGRYLAEGLAAIHSAGLIHGSLTPGAVVLAPDGRPMLSGLILGLGQHTGHASLNSPSQLYLAPESLRDGTTTTLSDLYALGAVLHAALTGRPPLAARMGETAGEHILRVLHEPPARLDELPDQFADVVGQLLEKDPANRPQDAETVAALLAAQQTELTAAAASRPVVRPVVAMSSPPSAEASQPPPPATATTLQRPRPALMSRSRLRSWPPAVPAPDAAQPRPSAAAQPAKAQPVPRTSTPAAAPPPSRTPPAPDPAVEPRPPRRRTWLFVSASVAVAAALITALAIANRQDSLKASPTAQSSLSPTPALSVRLNPPADHSTYVDLSWTGDPGLNYVVVIAQVGKPAVPKLVYKRTKHRVAVVPGVQYCFAIQATDGISTTETKPQPVRDAQCDA
ncbi:serine/threonine protein kinase [Kribbella catacumbae]|uniref:serine/threonine protein kinase n=1 Tax=Kribbella catacumbae TaxID=460086 RepID=UPI000475EE91|nr:serine/threonine-protein kinase [Kribbella catacumbae]